MQRFNVALIVGFAVAGFMGSGGCCSCCAGGVYGDYSSGERACPCAHACSCGQSCSCGDSCSCGESGSCASCSHQSCGCNQRCPCERPCSCCRPCLFQNLFPWIRCERCKGAGEQYGECSQCGCGECYEGDWRSQPPRCEPCDHCGNWVGPGEPLPPYQQMPARYGSGYYGTPSNGPMNQGPMDQGPMNQGPMDQGPGPNDSMPTVAPPTTLPPSNPPMHTSQRPNLSNY